MVKAAACRIQEKEEKEIQVTEHRQTIESGGDFFQTMEDLPFTLIYG